MKRAANGWGDRDGTKKRKAGPSEGPEGSGNGVCEVAGSSQVKFDELCETARQKLAQREYSEVIDLTTKALEIKPGKAIVLRKRAEAYRITGRYHDAIKDATNALKEKEDLFILGGRAEAYRQIGEYGKAIEDASKVLDKKSGDLFCLATRADAYRQLGQFDKAIEDASKVLKKEPGDLSVLRTRADAYRHLGQFDKAIEDASKVLDKKSGDSFCLATRADAYRQLGQFDKAIEDATKAIGKKPNHSSYCTRANAYLAIHNFAQAALDATSALAITPGYPFAISIRAAANLASGKFAAVAKDAKKLHEDWSDLNGLRFLAMAAAAEGKSGEALIYNFRYFQESKLLDKIPNIREIIVDGGDHSTDDGSLRFRILKHHQHLTHEFNIPGHTFDKGTLEKVNNLMTKLEIFPTTINTVERYQGYSPTPYDFTFPRLVQTRLAELRMGN